MNTNKLGVVSYLQLGTLTIFRVFKFLLPQNINNSEKYRKAKIFYNLAWGFIIIFAISTLINCIVLPHNALRWLILCFISTSISVVLLVLNKRGYTVLSSYLYVLTILGVIMWMAFSAGGIKSPIIQTFPIVVLVAGLLLGWKHGIFIGIIVIICGFGLVVADFFNVLPISSVVHNPLSIWISNTIYIALIVFLQYLSVALLNKALSETKQELTLRSKVEDELKRSEAFRKQVFDSSPIPIVVMDATTFKYIDCNQAAIDIYGFSSRNETLGLTAINVSAPEQYDGTPSEDKAQYYIDKAITDGSVVFEWKHQRPNGEYWDSEVHLMSFNVDDRQLLQFTLIDITERKQAEKKVRESEERFRKIIENMPILLNAFDENGNIIVWNKACEEVTGYSAEEIIGNPKAMELFYPDPEYREKVWNSSLNPLLKNNEFELVSKNGEVKTIEWFDIYHHLSIQGWASWGMGQDITERKKAEKALQESEEKYRKLVEAFPDMIMLSDLNKNILYANDILETITGLTKNDYTNPNRIPHIHPDDQKIVSNAIQDLLTSNKTNTGIIENRFIDAWGKVHWFSGSMAKLYINNQIVLQTVTRDITEKKILETELEKHRTQLEFLVKERTEELAAANEELNVTNEELFKQREELQASLDKLNETQRRLIQSEKMASLGVLSAGIAHEINNPLNFIHGGVLGIEQYFKNNLNTHFEKVYPLINAIHVGVKRASEIVSSLSHYSRKEDLPHTKCDIHVIIDNCLVMLQNKLKGRVEINRQYTHEPHLIIGNEGKLHQAILNILSNAEQAIGNKGIITVTTEISDNEIVVFISDSGCGISPENIKKIFDPFFTTKAPGKGTGLGLSITYNIIQEHNGTIEFESNVEIGTKAIIKLPLYKI